MTGIEATFDQVSFDRERGKLLPHILIGAAAVAALVPTGLLVERNFSPDASRAVINPAPIRQPSIVLPSLTDGLPTTDASANQFGPMIVERGWLPGGSSRDVATMASLPMAPPAAAGTAPPPVTARLPDVIPLPPERDVPEIADGFPLPPMRPDGLGEPTPPPPPAISAAPAPAPAQNSGNILQRLFGALMPPGRPGAAPPPAPPALASAPPVAAFAPPPARVASLAPDSRNSGGRGGPAPLFPFFSKIFGSSTLPAGYDQYTAIYDISARVVYMPDGSKLEAHSGLGDRLDDPRHVNERARGATPPHLYELTMRESLFHGVQALRLNPVGDSGLYGRDGLLAHPYMLGPNGDSNGCVSFKDYNAFLRAYQNGQIRRLAVVASL